MFYTSVTTRFVILLLFFIATVVGAAQFLLLPLLRYFNVIKQITNEQAEQLIRKHFPQLKDTLLNTLELKNLASTTNPNSNTLLWASIEKRETLLHRFTFSDAIDYRKTLKYSYYLAPLLFSVLFILFFQPHIITSPAYRILHYNKVFEQPAPFSFILGNDTLKCKVGEDFTIKLKLKGRTLPQDAYILVERNEYIMKRTSSVDYEYTVKNLHKSINFHFKADNYNSQSYTIQILNIPKIKDFSIEVIPPSYTSKEKFKISNVEQFSLPLGSQYTITIHAANTKTIQLYNSDSTKSHFTTKEKNIFIYNTKAMKSSQTVITLISDNNIKEYIYLKSIVLPDLYPQIDFSLRTDTASYDLYYFNGIIKDDYGFTDLHFHYKHNTNELKSIKLPITKADIQEFFFMFDFSQFAPGDSINYYFEVRDNDVINGPKSTKSQVYSYKLLTKKELKDVEQKKNEFVEKSLDASLNAISDIQKQIQDLKKKMLNENISTYEKNQMLRNIEEKQKDLTDIIQQLNKENKERNKLNEKYDISQKELLEKQKQVEELLNSLLDDEMKKLLDQIKELMEQNKTKDILEKSEQIQMSYKDLERKLEKDLQLLKRFSVEQKLQNTINELKELSEKQNELSENKNIDAQETKEKQQEILKEFKEIQEEYKRAMKENSELEKPLSLDNLENEMRDLENNLEKTGDNNKVGEQKKQMKRNSEQMNDIAEKIQQMLQNNSMEQSTEDMNTIRQILDNLITFSFKQEELLQRVQRTNTNDPMYITNNIAQNY
ncbi:MAG: hypothetical protein SNJ64_04495, partial [Endomicrobiia bacterium]